MRYKWKLQKYYKLGKKDVPVLEKMYNSNKLSGVYAYISALAVQDITGCNLYEEFDLDWSTAEEFYTLWKAIIVV